MQQPDFFKIAKAHLRMKRKNDDGWIYRKEQKKSKNNNYQQQHQHGIKNNTHGYRNNPNKTAAQDKEELPIYYGKIPLTKEVMKNPTTIVMSETGSGKTTQLPQYLLSTYLPSKGMVCCTQPRRIAAITVATRVASERDSVLGEEVGYCVRFEDVTSSKTKLKYMTDGMLLREALLDPLLKKYSVVVLDEAHERSVQTDVLFGIVKKAQTERQAGANGLNPLKIVIMSATLQAEQFVSYFNNAKICFIEGRRHPIKVMYAADVQKDYPHASLVAALQLHREMPVGHDILVFLTGQEEILSIANIIKDISKYNVQQDCKKILAVPLFASLPHQQQLKAFQPAPAGYRKIILATNIAETSVTIPNVKYVIDCGMVKAKDYNPTTGVETLKVQPVSKAQSRQRCGRAGRECPGVCYRLYPETVFHAMNEETVPEIMRCNLKNVVLNLLVLGLKDVVEFDFMTSPSTGALKSALQQLVLLQAVESMENQKVTDIGKKLSCFPLEPSLSRCILAAHELNCTQEILSIVAMLSVDSLTYIPHNEQDKGRAVLRRFSSTEGDMVTMLRIFREYKKFKCNSEWCKENYIDPKNMKTVVQIRNQLNELCVRDSVTPKSCGNDFVVIRKALSTGMFLNSAERQPDGSYRTLFQKQTVHIHPSSVLFNQKPAFVVFNELVQTSRCYMRDITVVDPKWLIEASPSLAAKFDSLPKTVET